MTRRNLAWIRTGISRIVNFNEDQPDQDFAGSSDDAWRDVDFAANQAYEDIFHTLLVEGDPELFLIYDDIEWASGELTYRLPEHLDCDMIQSIDDNTSANPGARQRIYQRGVDYGSTIYPLTGTTLQWGSTGAPADKTLRIFYYPVAREMKAAVDEPIYIPYRFRRILHWEGSINLRLMADDAEPPRWASKRNAIKEQMLLAVSEGRPRIGNKARIQMEETHTDYF